MKNLLSRITCLLTLLIVTSMLVSCELAEGRTKNTSAFDEQAHTEVNQRNLNANQPAPSLNWSLERDNLIKRTLLQNDRTVNFYMYVLLEGYGIVGYYQVNKVSSVNSQLTNPAQIIKNSSYESGNYSEIPSPAEDGSYGTNGDGVFGFTPEDAYLETNCKYISSTVPLKFKEPVPLIAEITALQAKAIKETMVRIGYKGRPTN